MRKLLVIPFLFFLTISGLLSCSQSDEPIYYYYKQPAKVVAMSENSIEINTIHGNFLVTDLIENDLNLLKVGNLLSVGFFVDMNDQPDKEFKTAAGFSYILADNSKVIIPENEEVFIAYLTDETYTDSISSANPYTEYIDSLAFFEFKHTDISNNYIYELIFNPETGSDGPTFYIRPTEVESDSVEGKEYITYAFDLSEFIKIYKSKNPEAESVTLSFKYRSRTAQENIEDEYKSVSKTLVFDLSK